MLWLLLFFHSNFSDSIIYFCVCVFVLSWHDQRRTVHFKNRTPVPQFCWLSSWFYKKIWPCGYEIFKWALLIIFGAVKRIDFLFNCSSLMWILGTDIHYFAWCVLSHLEMELISVLALKIHKSILQIEHRTEKVSISF